MPAEEIKDYVPPDAGGWKITFGPFVRPPAENDDDTEPESEDE